MSTEKYVFVYDKDYAETVTSDFKSFLDNDLYIDLVFVCRNNKKVGAHQVVLGCLSNFFYSIFIENLNTIKEKVLHIYVPDIRAKIMKYILQFIYSGKAVLNKEELAEFNEDIKLLGMPLGHFSTPSETSENSETLTTVKPITSQKEETARAPRIVKATVDLTDTSTSEDHAKELPNETIIPPALPVASDANANVTTAPPIIDKNPTDNQNAKIAENRTTSASLSSSSDVIIVSENHQSNLINSDITVSENKERKEPKNGDRRRKRNSDAAPPLKRKFLTASIDLDGSDDDDVITIS